MFESGQDFVFQQDGAACHTSQKAIKWMEENNVPLLKWVSSSPDLSPIETLSFSRHNLLQLQRQLPQQECLAELLSVFGNEAPQQSTISRWYGEFKSGRVSLSDDPRVGAPKTAVIQENVDAIEASLKISKTSIQKILDEELGVRKLVSRWIPHLLTEGQKAAMSAVWVFQDEEKPTKVIRSRSVSKKMVATFVSKAGHIASIPLNEQRTVTADWYTTICLPKVITELRKINPERRIILHQANASSHTAQKTRQYLTEENVELLDHPPYSPDLSPNDFFTFPKIKNRLRGSSIAVDE
ncbi:unnamed protein product [Acanthoscelides obtectus]|uniref:Transposase n=1 Tax=Acanthoscelides obtectus TaxID=200917 RepID=A0A9P0L9G0_ACAOB|nr:unnamed protein product [Acanthoscelides obtectus]CAK1630539.1 Histone-lysine N-methyltransferase SETMAR [Acanthoscelides obtectus]